MFGLLVISRVLKIVLDCHTALCAEDARHIPPGQRPGVDKHNDFSPEGA